MCQFPVTANAVVVHACNAFKRVISGLKAHCHRLQFGHAMLIRLTSMRPDDAACDWNAVGCVVAQVLSPSRPVARQRPSSRACSSLMCAWLAKFGGGASAASTQASPEWIISSHLSAGLADANILQRRMRQTKTNTPPRPRSDPQRGRLCLRRSEQKAFACVFVGIRATAPQLDTVQCARAQVWVLPLSL